MALHNETGKQGEVAAANLLRSKGFEVLVTNYRFQKAEIDIIATLQGTVVFVEVKTRSSEKFGFPEEAVHKKKQQLMALAAAHFMEEHKLSGEIRFDVISVYKTPHHLHLHHIEDAFFPIAE